VVSVKSRRDNDRLRMTLRITDHDQGGRVFFFNGVFFGEIEPSSLSSSFINNDKNRKSECMHDGKDHSSTTGCHHCRVVFLKEIMDHYCTKLETIG